jgi:hypothetical protein
LISRFELLKTAQKNIFEYAIIPHRFSTLIKISLKLLFSKMTAQLAERAESPSCHKINWFFGEISNLPP